MRLALLSYFGDVVFPADQRAAPPDILQVGIHNPLGDGVAVDLLRAHPELIGAWRRAAQSMLARKEMELGWTPGLAVPEESFKEALADLLGTHPITRCELTILASARCCSASSSRPASRSSISVACCAASNSQPARSRSRVAWAGRARPRPPAPRHPRERAGEALAPAGAQGRDRCDGTQRAAAPAVLLAARPLYRRGRRRSLARDPRGGAVARGPGDPATLEARRDGERVVFETPEQRIARMLTCIEIAHVFLGTCEAFQELFFSEMCGHR